MNIRDTFEQRVKAANTTKGAVNTFREYILSTITKYSKFIYGKSGIVSLYLQQDGENVINKVVTISQEQYQYCQNNGGTISLPYDDNGATVTVSTEYVLTAFEEQIGELKAQEQFIQYACEAETVESSTFITRVRALSDSIPSYIIEKYSQFCSISNSPVELLKNFFTTINSNKITYVNTNVSLVDPDQYVGNVWEAAWSQFSGTISSFFANLQLDIWKIDQFFRDLVQSLTNLVKWGFSKLFGNLMTVYDKYSGAVMGLMDFPIFQLVFNDFASFNTWINEFTHTGASIATYAWDHTSNCMWMHQNLGSDLEWWLDAKLASYVDGLCHDVDDDGAIYDSVTELVVPGDQFDLCLRIGKTQDDKYVFAGFMVSDYGSWSKYTDAEIKGCIFDSLKSALMHMSAVIPMINEPQTVDDTSIKWQEITELFMDYPDSYPTKTLPQLCKLNGYIVTDHATGFNQQINCCIISMLMYACLMSRGFVRIENGALVDETFISYRNDIFWAPNRYYEVGEEEAGIIVQLDEHYFTDSEISEMVETYKPYIKQCCMPITIHYQSTSEQASEILAAIRNIIVAVVVVYAAVRILKWVKARKQATYLAWAASDSASWDYAANPTPENLAKFTTAYKKAKHISFINNILGIASSTAVSFSNSDLTNKLISGVSNTAKGYQTSTTGNINTVGQKVDTANGKLVTANNGIVGITTLIKGEA